MADFQPWYAGQTFPSWQIPLNAGGAPDNLTGIDITKFTLIFRNLNGVDTTGGGTFTVYSTYPAVVLYKPTVNDVTAAGNGSFVSGSFTGNIIIEALYPPSNSATDRPIWDPVPFNITGV